MPSTSQSRRPGNKALRKGRVTIHGACYFLTMTTRERKPGLMNCSDDLLQISGSMETEELWKRMAMVVMPDHLHLLVSLGERCGISESIRLFKGRGSVVLRPHQIAWQKEAVFEHRLRPQEEISPYLRYMLLNPYAKRLLGWDLFWKGWWCSKAVSEWFYPMTNGGRPYPEWLKDDHPVDQGRTRRNGRVGEGLSLDPKGWEGV